MEGCGKLFLGTFKHPLDAKNRLIIPSRLRERLTSHVVISKGFEGCLEIRSQEDFKKYAQEIVSHSNRIATNRMVSRQILANSFEVEFDSLGRILLPNHIAQLGNLTKDVVIIGVGDRVELWEPQKYEAYDKLATNEFESSAELMNKDDK